MNRQKQLRALKLAIDELRAKRKRTVARADAARYGFPFGLRAKDRLEKLDEAIVALEQMKESE